MPVTFNIPTIYSVIDKFSAPIKKMNASAATFSNTMSAGIAKTERVFRKITPVFSETSQQLFSFAKSAAIAGALVGGVHFSYKAITDYETALASFHVIIGNEKPFEPYKKAINSVANETESSAVAVAASFEKIAGLNATFADTAESISAVSKASIILSKASGEELGPSAESLVGIMNQFGFAADQANRTINTLAAGTNVGAASIVQTSEAFTNFGSVAKGANITLEQSVGLIQTLGQFSIFGAEAGTKLRGSILKLQQAGVGYKSGQFQINDALEEARKKVDNLKTSKQKDMAILKLFGAENIATGKILLSNVDTFNKFTKGVTDTNAAQEAAALRSATFAKMVERLQNKFINWITTSEKAATAMNFLKIAIKFVTNHLNTIIKVIMTVIKWYAIFKFGLMLVRGAMFAYNIVLGLSTALTGASSIAMRGNIVALGAQKFALGIVTAAQWLWNAAMSANPIVLIIIAIAAMVTGMVIMIKHWDTWGAAISLTLGPLGAVISLVMSLRKHWQKISDAFSKEGIVAGIKQIGVAMIDSFITPIQQVLKLIAKLPDWLGGGIASKGVESIDAFRGALEGKTDWEGNTMPGKEAINPKAVEQDAMIQKLESTNNANVNINVRDKGNLADVRSDSPLVTIRTSSTMPAP